MFGQLAFCDLNNVLHFFLVSDFAYGAFDHDTFFSNVYIFRFIGGLWSYGFYKFRIPHCNNNCNNNMGVKIIHPYFLLIFIT